MTVKIGAATATNIDTCGYMPREGVSGDTVYIPCRRPVRGRKVLIITSENTLTLCEVAIYGKQG